MTLFPKKLGHCVKMEMDRKLGYLNTEMPHLIEENNISHIEPEVFLFLFTGMLKQNNNISQV